MTEAGPNLFLWKEMRNIFETVFERWVLRVGYKKVTK